jgi:branched-chain amino acid transport system substrate-binding protein
MRYTRVSWFVAFLVLVTMSLAACRQAEILRGGVRVPVDEAVEADLRAASRSIQAGQLGEAERNLERFLVEFANSPRRDEALFLLADVQLRSGDPQRAVQTWRRLIRMFPRSEFVSEARLRSAETYRDLNRVELGRGILAEADFSRATPPVRAKMHRLLADLSRASGDFSAAVLNLALTREYVEDANERSEIDGEAAELVADRLRDTDLEVVASKIVAGPIANRVVLELARRQLARGKPAEALASLERLPADLPAAENDLRQTLRTRAQRGETGEDWLIGVALPLTGPYATLGQATLRGLVMGLDLYGENPGRYRLIVRDTQGDPQKAAQVTRELANEGVNAIIGPVRSAEAAAASAPADEARVPLLTFSQEEVPKLESANSYVFRFGLSKQAEVGALVEYATEVLEAKRFAILYPRDAYGTEFKNLFWEAVERRGGKIVGCEGYEPEAVDIQSEVKKLVGLEFLTSDERARITERDKLERRRERNEEKLLSPEFANLPPYVDFDALFVPDFAGNVGVVLPQLRFYDVRDVAFLGTSGWNDPKLLELARREATGSVFVDEFHARSQRPAVNDFVSRFTAEFGSEPGQISAEGYDAAMVLRKLTESQGSLSAEEVRSALITLREFGGVSGLRAFDAGGSPQKDVELLTVRRGEIRGLDEAP